VEKPLWVGPAGTDPLRSPYSAASFNFFRERTLSFTLAGFAANVRSCLVKGSMPTRFFLAGTCTA
jgi:hypothetical protein